MSWLAGCATTRVARRNAASESLEFGLLFLGPFVGLPRVIAKSDTVLQLAATAHSSIRSSSRCSSELDSRRLGVLAPLVGLEVEQVWVWWSLRLVFDLARPGAQGAYVDVTNFDFTDEAGVTHKVKVEEDPVGAGRVLTVLHHRVTDASAVGWELKLAFDNGASLVCAPDPRYEAWAAAVPGHPAMFCPIGGDPNHRGD